MAKLRSPFALIGDKLDVACLPDTGENFNGLRSWLAVARGVDKLLVDDGHVIGESTEYCVDATDPDILRAKHILFARKAGRLTVVVTAITVAAISGIPPLARGLVNEPGQPGIQQGNVIINNDNPHPSLTPVASQPVIP
jgi:hypothetical protein